MLRLFAEIASSVDHDEGARAPDRHDPEQGGEDISGVRSSTEGAKYRRMTSDERLDWFHE